MPAYLDSVGFNRNEAGFPAMRGMNRFSVMEVELDFAKIERSLDARRVASFFITWLGQNPQKTEKTTNSQRSQLQAQIAPGRSRGSNGNNISEPRTYTPNDIAKFFADVRTGKYKGKEQERDRIERDIFAAQKDGRIVMNG